VERRSRARRPPDDVHFEGRHIDVRHPDRRGWPRNVTGGYKIRRGWARASARVLSRGLSCGAAGAVADAGRTTTAAMRLVDRTIAFADSSVITPHDRLKG
jgi:hypothetical protein